MEEGRREMRWYSLPQGFGRVPSGWFCFFIPTWEVPRHRLRLPVMEAVLMPLGATYSC